MKRNWLLYLVIFSLALNVGAIGTFIYFRHQDQAQKISQGIPPPLGLYALWRSLNLDASQRQALHGLFPEHRRKVKELRKELFQKRGELFGLLKGEASDPAALRAKIGEISALQGQLEEELIRFLLEFKKGLKPEQTAAFLDLVQTRLDKALCGPRGGRGHRFGAGLGSGLGRGQGMGPECPE